jgi:hypothetical protein
LKRAQAPPTHGPVEAVTADAMALSAQDDLQSARTIAARVVAKGLHPHHFPSRLALPTALLLRLLPRVISTQYAQHVAEQANGVRGPLSVYKAIAAHWVLVAKVERLSPARRHHNADVW